MTGPEADASRRTPILQFGTSRFLQAHADLFVSEALGRGEALGPITVVQSSGDASRSHRLAALTQGFPVRVRGIEGGAAVDRTVDVTSVRRALSTATDWPEVVRVGLEEAEVILSNTADTGFAPRPGDDGPAFDQAMSYPAKLMHLLLARFREGGRGVQVMPTELVADNGAVLRDRVLALAEGRGAGFREWLRGEVRWVSSLVDRIVSEPIEPAGAVAEPYALWAIGDAPGLVAPCRHDAVQVVRDLDAVAALKLYILNLGHTALAEDWLRRGSPEGELVRLRLAEPAPRAALVDLLEADVLPGFAAAGMGEAARAYLAVTLERFDNPFLDHRLAEIAQNHEAKVERRVGGFLAWARGHGDAAPKSRLEAMLDR